MQSFGSAAMAMSNAAPKDATAVVTDRPTSAVSGAGNDTVTLGAGAQVAVNDYMDLAKSQTVNANSAVEEQSIDRNATSTGLTYAGTLQAQANYNLAQAANFETGSTERNMNGE
jgi:outer membrane receptor protein involved in Fe transport